MPPTTLITKATMQGSAALKINAASRPLSCSTSFDFCLNLNVIEQCLPHHNSDVLPGIKWGHYCQLYTPAFWKFMYLSYDFSPNINSHRLGTNILEEITACLLGGYGMPAELGLAAFERLRNEKLIKPGVSYVKIKKALSTPFVLEEDKSKKYRFYNQKSKYIYSFLQRDDLDSIPEDNDISFRNWLLNIDGIGPKTASWITRNWFQSENVAILDIHILRAGRIAGFFDKNHDVSSQYFDLERCFIRFCRAIQVLPSNMDAIIWNYMKKTNKLALKVLSTC